MGMNSSVSCAFLASYHLNASVILFIPHLIKKSDVCRGWSKSFWTNSIDQGESLKSRFWQAVLCK